MADGDVVLYHGGVRSLIDVNHAQVLNVRSRADANVVNVTTYHRSEPYTHILA